MAPVVPPTLSQEYDPAVPVALLEPHPRNVNEGDVGSIASVMEELGFFGACLVQKHSNRIIAGKHRWLAAQAEGKTDVPVLWTDVDDDTALRIMLADNRTARLGIDDDRALAALLVELAEQTERQLAGTGYDGDALDELLGDLAFDPHMPKPGDERYTPAWIFEGMGLHFDLDVAAPVNPASRRTPADRFLTVHDDGLTAEWDGLVWMNPPYSAAADWARRWTKHPDGVCLIIVSNSPWVPELCEQTDLFCFVPSVDFDTPVDQVGAIGLATFMAAQGSGTPGLARLAERQNWPLFSRKKHRPNRAEAMMFRAAGLA